MAFNPESLPVPDLGLCCLQCGYGLAGLPSHRCPECGKTFTMDGHIPKGDFPVVIFNGKEVRSLPEIMDLLRRYQIPFMEVLGPADSMYGMLGATHRRSRIGVMRSRYWEVIDLFRRRALDEPLPVVEEFDRPDWTCPGCEEENPGSFEVCWNCGEASPGDAGD